MPQETLILVEEFRNDAADAVYGVSKEIKATRIEGYLHSASLRLRGWVGDAVYDDALEASDISALSTAEQRRITQRRRLLKAVEGDLTMSYLIVNLASAVRPQGLVMETKAEGQTVERFMTPEQTRARSREFFDQACQLVQPFLLAGNVPEADFILQETELG